MHFASGSLLFKYKQSLALDVLFQNSRKVISSRQSQLLRILPPPICLQSTSIPCLKRSSGEVTVTHFSDVLILAFILPFRVQQEVNVSEQDFCMYFSSLYRRGVRSFELLYKLRYRICAFKRISPVAQSGVLSPDLGFLPFQVLPFLAFPSEDLGVVGLNCVAISKIRLISSGDLHCCLLSQCKALRTFRSSFLIATQEIYFLVFRIPNT